MDAFFEKIAAAAELPAHAARSLVESGFTIIHSAFSPGQVAELSSAYDHVMAAASEPDFHAGSTTNRLYDLVNRGPAFDVVYLHPSLLEASARVIGEPFKLSSLLARTVRPGASAQNLHADLPPGSPDAPMLGFIVMVDPFHENNGATRFIPASHTWPGAPDDALAKSQSTVGTEIPACGEAGSIIVFNGAIWHRHGANKSQKGRRSIQGYFVRRGAHSGLNFSSRMCSETLSRINPLAHYLLGL